MLLNLSQIGQITLPTTDIERSEVLYGGVPNSAVQEAPKGYTPTA